MTSTNSLNSNRFLPMFKNVFKKNIAFFSVIQIISALFAFFVPRMTLSSIAGMAEYMEAGSQQDLTSSCVWSMSFFLYVAGCIWVFVLAISLFREIYSKRASTFYFAMPVKRGTYFNVNMLYGVVTAFIAYVLITVLSIVSVKTDSICPPELYTFEPLQVAKVLTVAFLSVIVTYAVFMLFAVLSGKAWHFIVLSLAAGDIIYSAVMNLIRFINGTIWGISIPYDKSWMVSHSAAFLESIEAKNIVWFVVALLIQFVIFYAIGYVVFQKRKAEIAEASLAGKIVPAVIFVIFLFSVGFAGLAMTDGSIFVKIFAALAATTVVGIVATAIFRQKAFTKLSAKCLIGTLIAVVIIALSVGFLPNIKYKNYVPQPSEVESVVVDEGVSLIEGDSFFSHLLNTVLFSFEGDYFYGSEYPSYSFTSEESKAKIEALHKKLTEQSTIDNHNTYDYYYHGGYSVKFIYKLKNGKKVERFYDVCTKDIYDEYIALMQTEEALRQSTQLNFEDGKPLFIGVVTYSFEDDPVEWDYDESEYSVDYDPFTPAEYVSLDEYDTLIDNIVKDRANESRDMFYSLMPAGAFSLYDYENYFRDEDGNKFNFEYFWDEEEINIEDYYPDYRDVSIVVYSFYDDVSDEVKAKLSKMTPEEMMEYDYNSSEYILEESYINLNRETDVNTIAYLKSIGLM